MNPEIEKINKRVAELETKLKSFEAASTLPKEVEDTLRHRLRIDTFATLSPSTKSSVSESQSVNENGVASYTVLKNPDGWEQRTVSGIVHYYPYWT